MNPLGLSWQERREIDDLLMREASRQVEDGDRCAEIFIACILAAVAVLLALAILA